MNSHDRRLIHVALQDDPDISTESLGDGSLKSVIISIKKQEV
jgi:spoIIIJ-associated protein